MIEPMVATQLTDETVIQMFKVQLPTILTRRPDLKPQMLDLFFKLFASKHEVVSVWEELVALRREQQASFQKVNERFEQVDQRFESLESKMTQEFVNVRSEIKTLESKMTQEFVNVRTEIKTLESKMTQEFVNVRSEMAQGFADAKRERNEHFSRIGSRWGVHIESVLRQTVATLLEKSYGAKVESKYIDDQEYDLIIRNGEPVLVEITTSVRRNIKDRLERKRELYLKEMGLTSVRVILAVGAIHPSLYNSLISAGFEVIVPEVYDED